MLVDQQAGHEPVFDKAEAIPTNPLIEYLANNYELDLAVQASWQHLDEHLAFYGSDAGADEVALLAGGADLQDPELSRADRRELKGARNFTKQRLQAELAEARWYAQMTIYGSEEVKEDALGQIQEAKDSLAKEEDPSTHYILSLKLSTTELHRVAMQAELDLMQPIFDMIEEDPALILTLNSVLSQSEVIDADDYLGLVDCLARNHFDPASESIIDAGFSALRGQPELTSQLLDEMTPDTDLRQVLKLLSEFALQHGLEEQTAHSFLQNLPLSELPDRLKNDVESSHNNSLKQIEAGLIERLDMRKQRGHFLLLHPPIAAPRHGSKKRSNGKSAAARKVSSRTTVAPNSSIPIATGETVDRRTINAIGVGKKTTTDGYISDPLIRMDDSQSRADWQEQAVAAIMQLKEFANYASLRSNPDDLANMLHSILSNPMGPGVTTMKASSISMRHKSGHNKLKSVLRFSPKKDTIDYNQSPNSKDTRIRFILNNTDSGTELVLLGVLDRSNETAYTQF